jgi:endonuclease-3
MKKDIARTTEIFKRLRAQNPAPRTELHYTNAYTLLVAVALSAQATDIGVNKATADLFKIIKTPHDMLKLGEAGLKRHIRTIGLFNTKAKNIMAAAKILVDDFGGVVPQTRDDLTRLPGVGRKTANVVLNEAFGQPTIAVDTHIFRVARRLGLSRGKTPDAVEADLEKKVPAEFKRYAHHWFILHGRYVCKARAPMCGACVLYDLCHSKDKREE